MRARAEELLEFVQLTEKRESKVEDLSGGMKRRLTIARSLINRPDLLLLDEPTTGLDPQARHVLWDRLFRLKQQGVTLVITTHYMDEAEQLCDRLVVMDRGVIAAEGSPLELIRRALHPRGRRAPLPGRRPRRDGREDRRPRRAGRGAARPDPGLQRRRRARAGQGPRAGPATRSPRWYAAPRWRTSSSGSPAGRWWTDDARCSTVPTTGRLSVGQGIGRQVDYWWTYYKRTWKGSIVSSFLSPLFYVLAMGVLLGGFVHATPSQLEGATSYLAFVVPGLIAAQAMTTGVAETTYPVMGGDQVAEVLLRPARDARWRSATSPTRCCCSCSSGSASPVASTSW